MFGEIVRAHRRRLGMSQEELAERIGVSARAIGKIENGRTVAPRPFTVRLLAEAFGLIDADRDRFCESAQDEAAPPTPTPAQLPPATIGFIGRDDQLRQLDAQLAGGADQPGTTRLTAIIGTAGVGKTAVAVHWAHRVRDRFPDGQLYLNLRGFDPSGEAVGPGDALRGFLEALGVAPPRIPAGLDARTGLYRSLLAGRRMLVVLDNARDAEQVQPLLPGAPGCLVVVTSRHQLAGLVARGGAHPVTVDVLAPVEAYELLARRLGADRLTAQPLAVADIISRTARLPLALAIVGARASTYPELPLATLAAELRDGDARLDALTGGDPDSDIRAVFSWSYRALSPAAARLFRLLGLHPGPALSVPAAASLAGDGPAVVRPALVELVRAHLVVEQEPGRFGFHDLLRAYAMDLAGGLDPVGQRQEAQLRMVDHYLHSAFQAAVTLDPMRHRIVLDPPMPGVTLDCVTGKSAALGWFSSEYPVVLALVEQSVRAGLDRYVGRLAWSLIAYADRQGQWQDMIVALTAGLAAGRRLGDPLAQAFAHRDLAKAYVRLNRFDEAEPHLTEARTLSVEVGDHIGLGRVDIALSDVHVERGRHSAALTHCQQALEQFRAIGHRHGQATALTNLGWVHTQLGDYPRGIAAVEQALALHAEADDIEGQAADWHSLGYNHHQLGQHGQAIACYQRSVVLCRELSHRLYEAMVLADLGDAHLAAGEPAVARLHWQYAVAGLDKLNHPTARAVRARLDGS